jgi:ABC-2 type transport system ATP-binding protein
MTGRELLRFFGHIRGSGDGARGGELAERLDLDLERQIKELSRGNRQKVGLVQAFLDDPELLVLDEPTSGLDPLVQETFQELVGEVAARGGTVFLSSHVLSEVQQVADRVALVRDGRILLVDAVESLRSRSLTHVEVTLSEPPPADAFAAVRGVHELERRGDVVRFALEGEIDSLVKALARFHVRALDVHEADLEDVFMALYRTESTGAP